MNTPMRPVAPDFNFASLDEPLDVAVSPFQFPEEADTKPMDPLLVETLNLLVEVS